MSGNYNRKDRWHQKAKEDGFKIRAICYKLEELQRRHNLMKRGSYVLDLGCWPGGWLQFAANCIGDKGIVWGVDIKAIEELKLPQVRFIQGDVTDNALLSRLKGEVGSGVDLVLSDMSPQISGIKEVDNAAALELAEIAFATALEMLRNRGSLVVKLFKAPSSKEFSDQVSKRFNTVKLVELDTTRKSSREHYLVALGFKP